MPALTLLKEFTLNREWMPGDRGRGYEQRKHFGNIFQSIQYLLFSAFKIACHTCNRTHSIRDRFIPRFNFRRQDLPSLSIARVEDPAKVCLWAQLCTDPLSLRTLWSLLKDKQYRNGDLLLTKVFMCWLPKSYLLPKHSQDFYPGWSVELETPLLINMETTWADQIIHILR